MLRGASTWLARTGGAAAVLLSAGALVLHFTDGGSINPYWRPQALNAVLYGLIGAYVASRRPAQRLGWILVVAGVGYSLTAFSSHYVFPADGVPFDRPLASTLAWVGSWTWALSLGLTTNMALLLFPSGHLPSPRWWPAAAVSWTAIAIMVTVLALHSWGIGPDSPDPDHRLLVRYLPVGSRLLLFGSVLAALSLIARYARTSGLERRQMRSVTFAGVGVAVGTVVSWTGESLGFAGEVVGPLIVGALGFALLRHRLYDIDVVINRALVYAGLSTGIAGTYAATVILFSVLGERSDLAPPLLGSVAVALVFAPLRQRLQHAVNRLFYGDREDPFVAIERLGQRLEGALDPEAALKATVDAVAEALRVPAVALETRVGEVFKHVPHSGGEPPYRPDTVSLSYQGEPVGRLLIWPRGPGEEMAPPDRRLVEGLAHPVAAVAHATQLASELQLSRERLVTAREEERRRIRRDLHDGLGARLSGVVLLLQASRNLLDRDSKRVAALLDELCTETQEAIADVRRLVYQLRPPALDELGLIAAIRQHATALEGADTPDGAAALTVQIDAPTEEVRPLPAAVEVAVYWVAVEALTNVVRHAQARSCRLQLSYGAFINLEIADDGIGFPPGWRAGVGVSSMRERLSELGGSLSIASGEAGYGTRIMARVPLSGAATA